MRRPTLPLFLLPLLTPSMASAGKPPPEATAEQARTQPATVFSVDLGKKAEKSLSGFTKVYLPKFEVEVALRTSASDTAKNIQQGAMATVKVIYNLDNLDQAALQASVDRGHEALVKALEGMGYEVLTFEDFQESDAYSRAQEHLLENPLRGKSRLDTTNALSLIMSPTGHQNYFATSMDTPPTLARAFDIKGQNAVTYAEAQYAADQGAGVVRFQTAVDFVTLEDASKSQHTAQINSDLQLVVAPALTRLTFHPAAGVDCQGSPGQFGYACLYGAATNWVTVTPSLPIVSDDDFVESIDKESKGYSLLTDLQWAMNSKSKTVEYFVHLRPGVFEQMIGDHLVAMAEGMGAALKDSGVGAR